MKSGEIPPVQPGTVGTVDAFGWNGAATVLTVPQMSGKAMEIRKEREEEGKGVFRFR